MDCGRNVPQTVTLLVNAFRAPFGAVIVVNRVGARDVGHGNVYLIVRADIPAVSTANLSGAIAAGDATGGKGAGGKGYDGEDMDHFDWSR
jgi:hypothetical protein